MEIAELIADLVAAHRGGPAPLVLVGDPVLRREAQPVAGQIDSALLRELADIMFATMRAAPGVGVAAPQIGIPLRMAVLGDPATGLDPEVAAARKRRPLPEFTILDPSYTADGAPVGFYEGCLSMPGFQAVVRRPESIVASYTDLDGARHTERLTGWPARIFQHETDHLAGTIYIDRALTRSITTNAALQERWAQPTPAAAAEALGFDPA
ncbi:MULTISPECIES: peptide deformylase [unclassified Nocardia]|uniref:peptide deformylase n=1 Tax=unclassified Nocardia TaxID=2637762 RepID=UPI001CE45802|nr:MULTISPECIES: peptide deformylase [unclassified Nocardia]